MSVFISILCVGLGGALGAISRWGVSLIPFKEEWLYGFPLLTFLINFIGCFLIGIVTELGDSNAMSNTQIDFAKYGFIGGFTSFSSFSIDTFKLLQKGKFLTASSFVILSIFLSLLGIFLGQILAKYIIKRI